MLEQNYNLLFELGLEVENGIIKDQDTGEMIKNPNTGKYLINYVEGTYADWRYYEDFNPYYNFKQLKMLVEYYLGKLARTEGRYFQVFCTDTIDDKVCLVAKNEYEEIRSRYYDRSMIYLCYIDFLFLLSGVQEDMEFYTLNREEINQEGKK